MVGFEIVLDVVVSVALLWLVGEGRKAPQAPAVEAEPTPIETEVATLAVSAKQHATVQPVPDVDLPSIGELFQESDRIGDVYLTSQEIEVRDAMRAAVVGTVDATPQRRGKGRRAKIEKLFEQAEELQERSAVSDAMLLTVAQVAVNSLRGAG